MKYTIIKTKMIKENEIELKEREWIPLFKEDEDYIAYLMNQIKIIPDENE